MRSFSMVLTPGQVTTSVQAKDITPLVATDNATVANTMEHERMNQLPINGRNIRNLLSTTPSIESYRVFGSTADGIEWILNGTVITDSRRGLCRAGVLVLDPV